MLNVYNILGVKVASIPVLDETEQIDLSHLNNGIYLYSLNKGDQKLDQGKFELLK